CGAHRDLPSSPTRRSSDLLLRLLFMSIEPSGGHMHVLGQDITRVTPSKRAQLRRRIGIVFQDFRLLDHLTTWENVALPLRVMGKKEAEYREDVTDLLCWVGLGGRINAYPEIL